MALDPTRPVADIMDRKEERALIADLITKRRNLLIYGPRRVGKSSLLRRIAADHAGSLLCIQVDCTRHETEDETARLILEELGRAGAGRWRRFWDWVKDHLAATRVRVITDADGPRLEIDPSDRVSKTIPDALEFVGRVADLKGVTALVILDEFQVVMARKDAPIAEMRSVAQDHPNLVLVLSGSVTTILRQLVEDRRAPFWKQLVELPIRGLGVDDVAGDLPAHGIDLGADAKALLRETCGANTLRLVEVLQFLQGAGPVRRAEVQAAVERVTFLHAADFERELAHVKPGIQRRTLMGLARDRPSQVMGTAFIEAHQLGAQGNVQRALVRLRALEILDEDNRFLDPLFAHWLRAGPRP